jgi:hypothetical protein
MDSTNVIVQAYYRAVLPTILGIGVPPMSLTLRGVTCVHCSRSIPVSRAILERETLLRKGPMHCLEDWQLRVFSYRCNACGGESMYTLGHIHALEEAPARCK